jgi:hypothetical protein
MPFLGSDDRRRADAQCDTARRELFAERANAGCRRRWMAEEWIERDLGRPAVGGRARVLEAIHLGTQRARRRFALPVRQRMVLRIRHAGNPGDRRGNGAIPFGDPCYLRPIATHHELIDDLLAEVIELAHWQEEPVRKPGHVEVA